MSIPTRCVDPVIKYCQECEWGYCRYPSWVETYDDLQGCTFDSGCTLGFDKGRPEDEPTEEELKEFEKWLEQSRLLDKGDIIEAVATNRTHMSAGDYYD